MFKGFIWGLIFLGILGGGYYFVQKNNINVPIINKFISPSDQITTDTEAKNTSEPEIKDTEQKSDVVPEIKLTNSLDLHKIPLGDGKVSTSPKVGYVYSCQTSFRTGGSDHAGDWIVGKTWDLTKKISVIGKLYWQSATFSNVIDEIKRILSGNGLPVKYPTGVFPIGITDPAYEYDRNPNSIKAQNISYSLPTEPTVAVAPSCVPMGAIGVALNGVAIYNALDDGGRDAVAHEVQDSCNGHPQKDGQYHYHGPSSCIDGFDKPNTLVGYALDGFGIYSKYDATGKEYTNADLDACHGVVSNIKWNGKDVDMYHYVLTEEYPYTLGCFKGTPIKAGVKQNENQQQVPNNSGIPKGTPPVEAINACKVKEPDSLCSIITPNGSIAGSCKNTHQMDLLLVFQTRNCFYPRIP
jgi:hypothetical protein